MLQIAFPQEQANNAAGETQANGSRASSAQVEPRSRTERKGKWRLEKPYAVSVTYDFAFPGFYNFRGPNSNWDHLRAPARQG